MTDKPVVTNATIATAIGILVPALMLVLSAFTTLTAEQTAALSGLSIAIIAAANALLGKNAAGKVIVPATVDKIVGAAVTEVKAEADERVRVAEAFGKPDQNQMPMPVRPAGFLPPQPPPPAQ